jgi:hypothetical protein
LIRQRLRLDPLAQDAARGIQMAGESRRAPVELARKGSNLASANRPPAITSLI